MCELLDVLGLDLDPLPLYVFLWYIFLGLMYSVKDEGMFLSLLSSKNLGGDLFNSMCIPWCTFLVSPEFKCETLYELLVDVLLKLILDNVKLSSLFTLLWIGCK